MELQKAVFPPIIAVFNHKGGVAKTTTAGNLAACLAAFGYRVVLADLDAQGNATGSFGILPLPPIGAMDVITGRVRLDEALIPTSFPGLSLLPATTQLRTAEQELGAHERSHLALRTAFANQNIAAHAHIVIIDCPPSLGTITGNALAAAAAVLIPARPDPYSHEGLVNTWHEIKRLRQNANAALNVAGILLTMTGEDVTGGDVARSMRAEFGDQVYTIAIENDPKVTEAAQMGVPVSVLDPDGGAGLSYLQATHELITRLRRHTRHDVHALAEPLPLITAQNTLRDWRSRLPGLQRRAGATPAWTAVQIANEDADDLPPATPPSMGEAPRRGFGWGALLLALLLGGMLGAAATVFSYKDIAGH
ncbi:MAG: ParA family [Rhodospirillaceae bacterium]|nr:MAG: ParA family [Rhodospirillaceae bacterium]TNC94977.1 MAG: ParA family protein [Stygiobacter sp.]